MKKKIITFLIAILFLLTMTATSSALQNPPEDNDGPILIVEYENGQWVIKNIGDATAFEIIWSIDIEAPIIFFGAHREGTIPPLSPGESEAINPGFVFGFGPAEITLTISAADLEETVLQSQGFLLGMFIIGL